MKHRGQLIIDEFELLRSVAGKSGLQLPPEYAQGRQLFLKRDKLFKKLKLDPNNEHHVAFLCSIVYDHLYLNKASPADTKFGDNKDFDLLVRLIMTTRRSDRSELAISTKRSSRKTRRRRRSIRVPFRSMPFVCVSNVPRKKPSMAR